MRSLKAGICLFAACGFFISLPLAGCSADGGSGAVPDPTTEEDPNEPAPAVLPPGTGAPPPQNNGGGNDAGAKDSGKPDATPPVDAGPPPPVAGTACTKLNEVKQKQCGACGTQETVCLAEGAGPNGKWSDYGACTNEIPDGCIPGTVERDVACGNKCGKQTRTCTQYCLWNTTACQEPANACIPNATEYSTAGCGTPGTYRSRDCGATCAWSNFTATCNPPNNANKLDLSPTVGGEASGQWDLSDAQMGAKVSGTCPNATVSSGKNYPYQIVEIHNTTGAAHTYDCKIDGPTPIDTLMTWYSGSLPPQDDAARKACGGGSVNDFCPAALACSSSDWSGLTGTASPSIPAGGYALIFYSSYYAHPTAGETTTGAVTLTCTTK
jgi:hypothetical protein